MIFTGPVGRTVRTEIELSMAGINKVSLAFLMHVVTLDQ